MLGSNFSGATAIAFNGTPATTFNVVNAGRATATVPVGATSGPISIATPTATGLSTTDFYVTPANDLCANAIAVACGSITNGSTFGATNTGDPAAVCTGATFTTSTVGVFYKFVGAGGSVTVSTCANASYDGQMGVYTGSCGTLACVAGDDDGCGAGGGASTITFTAVSGTTYYIYVAGYGAGTGNFTLSVSCANLPVINNFTPAVGPAGTSVALTGSNFTGATAVRFNGVAASFTVNSGTSISTSVPGGASTGPITVVTPLGTGVSSSFFEVLPVFTGTYNQCLSTTAVTSTGAGTWQWLRSSTGQLVAAVNDQGFALGQVSADFTLNQGAVRADGRGQEYLDRNWHLMAQNAFTGRTVLVRFYAANAEFATYVAANDGDASDATALTQLRLTQYQGPNEDCQLGNNTGRDYRVITPAAPLVPAGDTWFALEAAVTDHFSEFYVSGSSSPLPVELTDFTAQRQQARVLAQWHTAQEIDNRGFVVERSTDGHSFADASGLLPGAGTSAAPHAYAYTDDHAPAGPAYYRLRQQDASGASSYSPVVAVGAALAPVARLACYPQPAHAGTTVTGALPGAAIVLSDALGRTLATTAAGSDGRGELRLPAGLAAGVYVVRSGLQATRLVVE